MDKFEYKILRVKRTGVFSEHWFDGDKDVGSAMTPELLAPFGQDCWEVVATMQGIFGITSEIILKRRRSSKME